MLLGQCAQNCEIKVFKHSTKNLILNLSFCKQILEKQNYGNYKHYSITNISVIGREYIVEQTFINRNNAIYACVKAISRYS